MVFNVSPYAVFFGVTVTCFLLLAVNTGLYLTKKRQHDLSGNIFNAIIILGLIGPVVEAFCHIALQNIDNGFIFWMFVLKLYIVLVMAFPLLVTMYVTSIDESIGLAQRTQRLRIQTICFVIFLVGFTFIAGLSRLDYFYDGFVGYTYGLIVDLILIPINGILFIYALFVSVKNLRRVHSRNRLRFLPIVLLVILGATTVILQGILGKWLLLTTPVYTIIVIAIMNTIENPEAKMLGVVTSTKDKIERLGEAKDEFMSIASHQLRTPITAIEGYSDMLARGDFGKLTKEQEKAVRQINKSATNMSSSVKDFLDMSRIQTGRFMLEKTETNIKKVVEKRINQLRTLASEKQIEVVVNYGKKLPEKVMIDADKISQVIMNFVDNAIYYTHPKHKVIVDLVVHADQLVFTVEDEGIGVPAKEQGKLFGKFYRASNARVARPDGTGIGLFLARKIIVAHGGSIIFSSIENRGSVFGFSLPLDKLK